MRIVAVAALAGLLWAAPGDARTVTAVLGPEGDDGAHPTNGPRALGVDGAGNLLVVDQQRLFRVTPEGSVSAIHGPDPVDPSSFSLLKPEGVGRDGAGNVYVVLTNGETYRVAPDGSLSLAIEDSHLGDVDANAQGDLYLKKAREVHRIDGSGNVEVLIDETGDGLGSVLDGAWAIAVGADDDLLVSGFSSRNVFRVTPSGVITEIIDALGDGSTRHLSAPRTVAFDGSGNAYVHAGGEAVFRIPLGGAPELILTGPDVGGDHAIGVITSLLVEPDGGLVIAGKSVFRRSPSGQQTLVMAVGLGPEKPIISPQALQKHTGDDLLVAGMGSDNVFRVGDSELPVEIIGPTGDGNGALLEGPAAIAVDGQHNVYVAGRRSDNIFRIAPDGTITELLSHPSDPIERPADLAVDGDGNLFVAADGSNLVLKVAPDGTQTQLLPTPAGPGSALDWPLALAVDTSGSLFVVGGVSEDAYRVDPDGTVQLLIDSNGDGLGNPLEQPWDIAVDGTGNAYVAGLSSNNVFRIDPSGSVVEILDETGDGLGTALDSPRELAIDPAGGLYVGGRYTLFHIDGSGAVSSLDYETSSAFDYVHMSVSEGGVVYVVALSGEQAGLYERTPSGTVTALVGPAGDGNQPLTAPVASVVNSSGESFVAGISSDNVFRVDPPPQCDDGLDNDEDGAIDAADPHCLSLTDDRELVKLCGPGADLALAIPILVRLVRRRRVRASFR